MAQPSQFTLDVKIIQNINVKYYRTRNEAHERGALNMRLYLLVYSSDNTTLRNFRTHIKRVKQFMPRKRNRLLFNFLSK